MSLVTFSRVVASVSVQTGGLIYRQPLKPEKNSSQIFSGSNRFGEAGCILAVETTDEDDAGHVGSGKVVDGRSVDVVEARVSLHVEGLLDARVVGLK